MNQPANATAVPAHWCLHIRAGANGLALALRGAAGAAWEAAPTAGAEKNLTLPSLTAVSTLRQTLSIPGQQPAPVAHLQIHCEHPKLRHIWASQPPLGQTAQLTAQRLGGEEEPLFEGIITGVEISNTIRLTIESGQKQPLSQPLGLRTTAAWGHWRNVEAITWAWGRVNVKPQQYSADRRIFILADHAIEAVEEIQRDGIKHHAWAWHNGVDNSGHPVAYLELATSLSEGEALTARIRGRMHPQTGHLLQTPGDILGDILTHLAGIPNAAQRLAAFRHQTRHITLSGTISDNRSSARAIIDNLLQSIGGAWSLDLPGIAQLWPPTGTTAPDLTHPATAQQATALQATAELGRLTNRITINYDWDAAENRHRQSLTARAPHSIQHHGERHTEWPAPWLRHRRDAQALAARILSQTAHPQWQVRWSQSEATNGGSPRLGTWAQLSHPHSPPQGAWQITEIEQDSASASAQYTISGANAETSAQETITIEAASQAFETYIQSGITIERTAGAIIFTATGDNGEPLGGAQITLDGHTTRTADARGRVSYSGVARGRHTIQVKAAGYPDSETTVTV